MFGHNSKVDLELNREVEKLIKTGGKEKIMLVAVLILPTGGDVKPTLAYGLVTVEAQAAFVEAAGFGADRLVAGVDDGVEGEFRSFARIAIIAFAYVVFDDGQSQTETDLGGCEAHARRFQHGGAHGVDELVKRFAAQLAVVGDGLLA